MKKLFLFTCLIFSACAPGYTRSNNSARIEVDGETDLAVFRLVTERTVCESTWVLNFEDMYEDPDCSSKPYTEAKLSLGSFSIDIGSESSATEELDMTLWEPSSELVFSSSEGDFMRLTPQKPHVLGDENVNLEWIDLGASRGKIPKINLVVNLATLKGIQSLVGGDVDVGFWLQFVSRAGSKDWKTYWASWKNGEADLNHAFEPYDAPGYGGFDAFQVCYSVNNRFGTDTNGSSIHASVCSALFDFRWPR